jgi:excisionase family DNA binding protein
MLAERIPMVDEVADPNLDGWLTLAEIAEELRVSPATVRNWIARGKLEATRAGQRKLLVQRSELDRMLDESPPTGSGRSQPGEPPHVPMQSGRRAAHARPQQSLRLMPGMEIPAGLAQEANKKLQEAEAAWDAALDASDNAPPDPGFVSRLRAIAAATERQCDALSRARLIAGFRWRPIRDGQRLVLSHELRPGAHRPGPDHLWTSFDRTVERLGFAMEGTSINLVHIEYLELGKVLGSIVEALEGAAATELPDPGGERAV